MVVSEKAMDALKGIGLNLYERRLWAALLAKGSSNAGELSDIAKVPRSRAYDTLQSLAEKGFVLVQNTKPIGYVAIAPDEALERAKKKMESDIRNMEEKMDDLKSSPAMKELAGLFARGIKTVSSDDMSGSLKGRHLAKQHMDSMFKSAKKTINIVTGADGAVDLHENHYGSLRSAKESGVRVRIATVHNEKSSSAVKALSSVADVKHMSDVESLGGRFCVVDGSEMMMGLTDMKNVHDTQHVAVWSRSEHAAGSLMEPVFEMIWNNSKNVK